MPLPLLARQNPLADLFRRSDPAWVAENKKPLEDRVRNEPTNEQAWLELGMFSFEREQPNETLTILQRATAQLPDSWEIWQLLADVHLSDAASGPSWYARPGMTGRRTPPSPLDEETFRKTSLEAALLALEQVLRIDPHLAEATERRIDALFGLERWSEAERSLYDALLHQPSAQLAAKRGYCLLQMEQLPQAREYIEAALTKEPHSPDLRFVYARILEAAGDAESATHQEAQAVFYRRLLPGSRLEFTPEHAASLERMFGRKEGTSGIFSGDRLNDQIGAEIDALAARNDEASSELLASLAWSHFAHGPLERRAFSVLGERGDEIRLNRIYHHAKSPCTLGGCLREMVKLRLPGTYAKLLEQLPNDGGMFPIGVVGLIRELNDPRSAEALIGYTQRKETPFFEEALVALGRFDSNETRQHLTGWSTDKDAAPFAATALYQLTSDKKWLKPIERFVRKAELFEVWPIAEALRDVDTAAAKELVARFDGREAKEQAKREKKKKNLARD